MAYKPSEHEENYIKEQEMKHRLHKLAQEQQALANAEKQRLKELHWMHCPKCGTELVLEKYGKVEIDVCPVCKGLWLDANELDTIIEQSAKNKPFTSFLKILGGQ